MSVKASPNSLWICCTAGRHRELRCSCAHTVLLTSFSVEGTARPKGQQTVIKNPKTWGVSEQTFNGETVAGPFYNGAIRDQFVYFTLDYHPPKPPKRRTYFGRGGLSTQVKGRHRFHVGEQSFLRRVH